MSENYSLYNTIRKIVQNVGHADDNFSITKKEYMKNYRGTKNEALMEKLFSIFDNADYKTDNEINFSILDSGSNRVKSYLLTRFFDKPEDIYNGEEWTFNIDKLREKLGINIEESDFKQALDDIAKMSEEYKKNTDKKKQETAINSLKSNNSDIDLSEDILKKISKYADKNAKVEAIKNNKGETYYQITNNKSEDNSVQVCQFDKNGNLEVETSYTEEIDDELYGKSEYSKIYYNEKETTESITKFKNGISKIRYKNGSEECLYGKTALEYLEDGSTKLKVNKGLPNETKFNITLNMGKFADISPTNSGIIKMSEETKQELLYLSQKELIFGADYTLKVECNEVKIEFIKDEKLPNSLNTEIEGLNKKGMSRTYDFTVTKNDDDNYSIKYNTLASRNYASDFKEVIYDKNGNIIKTTEEMKNIKSKEESAFENFDVQTTPFASKLYKQGVVKNISDLKYEQKIGKNKYTVAIENNKIFVKCNEQKFSIDTSNLDSDAIKFLSKSYPKALFDIAKNGIKIILKAPETGGDGEYIAEENAIYIDPDVSDIETLHRRISHETGHIIYNHTKAKNEAFENTFKQELEAYYKKLKEIDDNVPQSAKYFENLENKAIAREKYENYVDPESNQFYCARNVYEFMAEAYCLLTTGHAKSEVTIAKLFPKTFEIAKEIIENQD